MRPGTGRPSEHSETAARTDPHHKDQVTADLSGSTPSATDLDARALSSAQVSWWSVYEYVAPILEAAGSWPMAGSAAWVALPDDDPAKLAALLDGARHHALRVETCQQQRCEASRDVSDAADWSAIATAILSRHNSAYVPREVA